MLMVTDTFIRKHFPTCSLQSTDRDGPHHAPAIAFEDDYVLAQKGWFLSALQQAPAWSVDLNALKMEMRCFVKLALDLSTVRLPVFAALSSTGPNNPINLKTPKYSQGLAAIDTTNAKPMTCTMSWDVLEKLKKKKKKNRVWILNCNQVS